MKNAILVLFFLTSLLSNCLAQATTFDNLNHHLALSDIDSKNHDNTMDDIHQNNMYLYQQPIHTPSFNELSLEILTKNYQSIEDTAKEQQIKIDKLEESLNKNDNGGLTFAVWAGILLAAVATLVTTLGVAMAIFSFVGYKKIMGSAQDVATTKSELVATSVAEELAPVVTERVLVKLLEDGNFDKVINEAVEKVIYRGIMLPGQAMLDEESI